jgi:hypothetical protein
MNFWCDRDLDYECENACGGGGVMIKVKEETGQSVMASSVDHHIYILNEIIFII